MKKREGSPFKGIGTIALKEAADHITSARMHLVMLLLLLTAGAAIYGAVNEIRATTAESNYLFLALLAVAHAPLPSFASMLGFLLPLLAIALGFDAVNGEFNRRTMSRILAQPIYRDAVLFGKFLGGLIVIGIALLTLWLLMTGIGILFLGLPPSGDDIARGLGHVHQVKGVVAVDVGDAAVLAGIYCYHLVIPSSSRLPVSRARCLSPSCWSTSLSRASLRSRSSNSMPSISVHELVPKVALRMLTFAFFSAAD